jgi:hypothetical protein
MSSRHYGWPRRLLKDKLKKLHLTHTYTHNWHLQLTLHIATAKNTHIISITKLSYHIRNDVLQPVEPIKYTLGGGKGTEITISLTSQRLQHQRFSQRFCWRRKSSGMLRCVVGRMVIDVSNNRIAFILRATWRNNSEVFNLHYITVTCEPLLLFKRLTIGQSVKADVWFCRWLYLTRGSIIY